MRVVIDRVEGAFAVLEVAGTTVDWPIAALPAGAAEGQSFDLTFTPIASPLSDAQARLDRLAARGPKGDSIDL
jgi:hypothetical protein